MECDGRWHTNYWEIRGWTKYKSEFLSGGLYNKWRRKSIENETHQSPPRMSYRSPPYRKWPSLKGFRNRVWTWNKLQECSGYHYRWVIRNDLDLRKVSSRWVSWWTAIASSGVPIHCQAEGDDSLRRIVTCNETGTTTIYPRKETSNYGVEKKGAAAPKKIKTWFSISWYFWTRCHCSAWSC